MIRRSFDWIFHNLFLRLWLVFAGLIGISTASTCPCCGQAAAACPAGFSILAIFSGILALLGVFRKRIASFFKNIFTQKTPHSPQARPVTSNRFAGWILFFLTTITILILGNLLFGKMTVKQEWRPAFHSAEKKDAENPLVPTGALISPKKEAADEPPSIPAFKNIEPPQGSNPGIRESRQTTTLEKSHIVSREPETTLPPDVKIAAQPPSAATIQDPREASTLERMRAIIGEDGSVVMEKETPDMIRYHTSNFLELNDDLYERLDLYEGKKVAITGYVYRRKDFGPDQFVVARTYVWCCLACGGTPVGPLCEWPRAQELSNDTWVKVEGAITREYFKDEYYEEAGDIPFIRVEKVERVPKLENPYVYLRDKNGPPRSGSPETPSSDLN